MGKTSRANKTVHFDDWIREQERGTQSMIFREHGISFATMWRAINRRPIKLYDTAKKLSEVTGGKVSIHSLCEPEPHAGA